ncbi:hypothetical protein H6P81_005975 [Aristolochia fimbriata]|uniref:Galactose oxidase n=1 Tax=Aristolochia fimbriata TaxID=158543 RepID=A0AAV7EYT0_ARIFI|nr:hypothetical protein H6P81_005975 [Aristolochia fimbriata]
MAAHVLQILLAAVLCLLISPTQGDLPGKWELLLEDAGISSMHSAVTHLGTVVLLDRTNNGPSRLPLPHCNASAGKTPLNPRCWAHSALFDPATKKLRPLTIHSDTWCSSGHFLPDGTLLHTGGDLDGGQKIRKFAPCGVDDLCDWEELESPRLLTPRWYSTNQILPDGSVIIIGGRAAHSVEYYPRRHIRPISFPFLSDAEDTQMDNLYPYLHLLPNGHLFVFANTRSVLYDFDKNQVVRTYPILEGGPRNYPSGGSSAMLALDAAADYSRAEILVCGGAQYGVFIARATDIPAHVTCGRIVATDPDPVWAMEDMPFSRVMGDMVMLPTAHLLIINGAQAGSQGFEMASNPVLFPVLYRPNEPAGLRFMTLNPGQVPRMYHSTANLLPDGRVLLAGSNPHYFYKFDAEYPTELRLEAFSPEYLSPDRANLRPVVTKVPEMVRHGEAFEVEATVPLPVVGMLEVSLSSAPFATHSFSQGQRLVKLAASPATPVNDGAYKITCTAPPSGSVAPPGYYMMFVINQGVPSVAKWVRVIL